MRPSMQIRSKFSIAKQIIEFFGTNKHASLRAARDVLVHPTEDPAMQMSRVIISHSTNTYASNMTLFAMTRPDNVTAVTFY